MSETGGDRPDVSKAYWATDPGGFGRTEPAGSKKLAGYDPGSPPSTPGEVPSATDHNWLFGFWADILAWLDGAHVREFSALNEAIVATSPPQLFRIGQPSGGNYLPKVDVFTPLTPAEITGNITDVKTDGQRIYIRDDALKFVAIDPEDGTTLWSKTLVAGYSQVMATTGYGIYMATAAVSGLAEFDPATGNNTIAPVGGIVGATAIESNGYYAVAIDSAATTLYFYSALGTGSIVQDGTVAAGANYVATYLTIDRNRVYVVFKETVALTYEVRCYDLITRNLLWTFQNPTVDADARINGIDCDGEFIYLACDQALHSGAIPPAGAPDYNSLILDRHGWELAHSLFGGYADLRTVIVDGRLVFFVEDLTGTARVGSAQSQCGIMAGGIGHLWSQGDHIVTDADGVSSCGYNTSNEVVRRRSADQPTTFQRVNGGDRNRRPRHNLAINIMPL